MTFEIKNIDLIIPGKLYKSLITFFTYEYETKSKSKSKLKIKAKMVRVEKNDFLFVRKISYFKGGLLIHFLTKNKLCYLICYNDIADDMERLFVKM